MIYFTSDKHYGHKNICKGTTQWTEEGRTEGGSHSLQSTRDFDTVEQMNAAIINGINNIVKEDDELYDLGDHSFGGIQNIWECRKQINCKNIHLVYGNHDHHIESNKQYELPTDQDLELFYNLELLKKDYPIKRLINLQDLFSSCQYYKELKLDGRMFILAHYAHRVWNHSHKGTIHLYGHSHGTLEDIPWGKSMDVGIDNAFKLLGKYRPFSITEIIDIMNTRETLIVDHHNKNTN